MKKRWTALGLLVALALGMILPLSALANTPSMYVVTSNGYGVHLRTETRTDNQSNILMTIPYGAIVDVYSYVNGGQWAHVAYNGLDGYMMSRYLSVDQPAPWVPSGGKSEGKTSGETDKTDGMPDFSRFEKVTPYDVVVRPSKPNGFVNFRWAPSMKCKVAMRCYANYPLQVIAQDSHWVQVADAATGYVGFMVRSFVTPVETGSSTMSVLLNP